MSATRVAASPAPVVEEDAQPSWRSVLAGPLVAGITLAGAIVAAGSIDVELRDPDGVAGGRLAWVVILVLVLVAMDVFVRAARRAQRKLPPGRCSPRCVPSAGAGGGAWPSAARW